MRWFKESKKRDIISWDYVLIPYEATNADPKSYDVKFYANLRELLAFYGIQKKEGVWVEAYEKSEKIIEDAMQRMKTMIINSFSDYEVTTNTMAYPDIWIIVSDILDIASVNKTVREVSDILNSFAKIVIPQFKKIKQ
jgi:hypothetical protein